MADKIVNPRGAFRRVADMRFPVDVEGEQVFQPSLYEEFRCDSVVTRGMAVAFVKATLTNPTSIRPMLSTDGPLVFAGCAFENGAIGQTIRVVTRGHAIAFTGNISIDINFALVKPAATPGKFEALAAASIDATTVVGTVLGKALAGTDTTTTFAPVWIQQI